MGVAELLLAGGGGRPDDASLPRAVRTRSGAACSASQPGKSPSNISVSRSTSARNAVRYSAACTPSIANMVFSMCPFSRTSRWPTVLAQPFTDALVGAYGEVRVVTDAAECAGASLFVLSCLTAASTERPFLDVPHDLWWSDVERRLTTVYAWAQTAATALTSSGTGRVVLLVDRTEVPGSLAGAVAATVAFLADRRVPRLVGQVVNCVSAARRTG